MAWRNTASLVLQCVLLLLLLIPLPLCAQIVVLDDLGRRLALPVPAQRLVSLAPNITELLFAAGAGAQLVGVSEYSDYPAAARDLPRIGGGQGLDLERILALRPDLVFAWRSGNPAHSLTRLEALGIPVYYSEPGNLATIATTLERMGRLVGTERQAARAALEFREQLQALRHRYAGRRSLRVFYEIWHHPLMTIGGSHLLNDALQLCGGENVFAALQEPAATVGLEAVLATDPQLIIASDGAETEAQWRQSWERWTHLTAVSQGNLYRISADLLHRPTPRMLQGIEQLCETLEQAREHH